MSTPPKINLELKNTPSLLASGIVTICEIIRLERVRALIISKDKLQQAWEINSLKSQLMNKYKITNEKQQLELYLKNFNEQLGGVLVPYKLSSKHSETPHASN